MFDKLSQFNALDITTASLISNDKELIESGSLLAFLDKLSHSLLTIEDNTALTVFDELHMLGITRTEIKTKLDKLYDAVDANEELRPSDFLALGELIGELNALNRYSKSLMYHQGIALRNEKVAKVRQLKTLTYQRVAKELYQIVVSKEAYSTFDAWSIISSIDLLLRMYLNPKLVISEHKATQSLAKYIGVNLSKGKRSQQQVKQRDIVFSYLEKHFACDCTTLYQSFFDSGCQDINGIAMPQEDRRLTLAYSAIDKLIKLKAFQSLKPNISLDVLVDKILKGLAKKYRISVFDAYNEAIYISKLYAEIPSYEPFYYQNNRAHKKLRSIQSGKLDEMVSNVFKKTAFM
ncbi:MULTISPECIES: hypothetical protein [Pseudoalteromonas]|uniref:Uncharacterized protein n=1 Tax=Pseudoalteromonas aliena SW19 TaxID=1314866 RepID=A0ABR9E0L9_9GAMM|nr:MULTISPECIES: hypothetical protein [Pseudoalteromonas]MBE0360153.1 hypothetical protein [Pseudoalteromonas aliena SW19]